MERITLELAVYLLATAELSAYRMGLPFNLAIADAGGDLIAFQRMDGALLGGIEIARDKAWTSAAMQMPTATLGRLAQPGGDAYGVNIMHQGRVVILGGGVPLQGSRAILGAIGVSGGTGAQDMQAADAAVQAFNQLFGRRGTFVPVTRHPSVYERGGRDSGGMTLALAKQLLAASMREAARLGLRCDIAIVDDGGNLVAFYRMDGARTGDIEVSQNKAWTSVAFKRPTAVLAQMAQPGGDAYGINTTHQGRVAILGGGIPFVSRGRIIGGVGVSGGTSEQDAEVAAAAVRALQSLAGH